MTATIETMGSNLVLGAIFAFGTPPSTALVAVIGWRLLEYWLPIPLALVSYLSLRLGVLRRPVPSRTRPRPAKP